MAKFEFKLPDIGEGVKEGEIVTWLVKVGDSVAEDQEMVEVMTDKATVPIGAPKAGTIAELRANVGDTVPVGSVLLVIETAGGAAAGEAPAATETKASAVGDLKENLPGMQAPSQSSPGASTQPAPSAPSPGASTPSAPSAPASQNGSYYNEKPLAAPATRKFARERGVDIRTVTPTGTAGRVTRDDIQSATSGSPTAPASQGATSAVSISPVPPASPVPVAPSEERVRIAGMRKRIYESMARSKHTAAHFTYVDECECTALIALRSRLKPHADAAGAKLTYLPFIIKAVVASLKKHPFMNCLVDDTTKEMVLRKTYDIGIAVATDAGLIVPVLRGADRMTLLDISKEIDRLATDARNGKTAREDLGGSSFTVTSLGKVGGLLATPVVNYPEVGILFVPEMKKRPVVKDDEIVIGHVMDLSVSFDHRIIDGHMGAAFTQEVIELLQTPDRLLLQL
jgi:pyruvate dehydrogenase E2 component (dihydrolipoamide acetyltransferase)